MSPMEQKKAEKAELEKELAEKRHALEQIESESPKTYKDLKGQSESVEKIIFETGALEERIRVIDEDIQALIVEGMGEKRKSILQKAQALAKEKKMLLKRIEEIDTEGQKLRKQFEENTPQKRIQTESNQRLKWERTLQENHMAGLTLRGDAIFEKRPHREEETTDAMPYRIKAMQEAGWILCPGQEIKEEELTPANSRLMPMVAIPDVLDVFV